MARMIYKILPRRAWEEATRTGAVPPSVVDVRDGFVHLSARDQVAETAARHFAGQRDLVLLGVDAERLVPGTLRWEPSRGGALFPHVYGTLPRSAVVAVHELPLGDDGVFVLPPGVPGPGEDPSRGP